MLSLKNSLAVLKRTNALLEGHFVLSSGLHSPYYIQCAKLLSQPHLASKICVSLSKKIKKKFNKIDIVLSPALGGVIVGYEIGRQLKIETIFAERMDGILVLRRGFKVKQNYNVLIVEDVITTGRSALECSNIVKMSKANIVGYVCIIDRSNEKISIKDQIISQMQFNIETFSKDKIPEDLRKISPIKPGSSNLSK